MAQSKSTLLVEIVSNEGLIFSGEATYVQVAGVQGDLGIAPKHAPLLTRLASGPVRVEMTDGEEELVFVSGGLLEVQPTTVTILADDVMRVADLNEEEAIKAKERAAASILKHEEADFDYALAKAELARAAGILKTLGELKKQLHIK